MRSNIKIYPLRLSPEDYSKLMQDSDNAGVTVSNYLRKLINYQAIKPKPPDSFKELAWEISKIGNDIDQLVRSAEEEGLDKEEIASVNFLMTKIIELMREKG